MGFREFTGELDKPLVGPEDKPRFRPFDGTLDQQRVPLPDGVKPSDAGAGRGMQGGATADQLKAASEIRDAKENRLRSVMEGGAMGADEAAPQPAAKPQPTGGSVFDRAASSGALVEPGATTPPQLEWQSLAPSRQQDILDQKAYANRVAGAPSATASPERSAIAEGLRAFDRKPLDESLGGAAKEIAGDALRGGAKVLPSLGSAAWGGVQAAADVVGAHGVSDVAAAAHGVGQKYLSQFDNPNGDKLVTGAFQSLGTAALAGAAGGANLAITAMVGQTAGDQYAQLRGMGKSVDESLEGAAVHGAAEFIGERIGMPGLGRLVTGMAGKGGMAPRAILSEALKQQGEEQMTLAIQAVYDKAGRGGTKPGMTLDDYLNEAVDTAKQTAIMTAAGAGGGAISRGARAAADQFKQPEATKNLDPMAEAKRQGFLRPTEARKAIDTKLDDVIATHGASPVVAKAIEQVKAAAKGQPLSAVPGIYQKFVGALKRRGLFAGDVPDADIAGIVLDNPAPADSGQGTGAPAEAIPAADILGDDGTGLSEPAARTAVDDAAHQAATSPENDRNEPTEGQKGAGNYAKGHTKVGPLPLSIENPEGSVRRGVDEDGTPWETPMTAHYGYIKNTVAYDSTRKKKQGVDVFVAPGTPEDYSGPVFVVDQINPKTGAFDEHKTIVGPTSEAQAEAVYRSNYAPNWRGFGGITKLPMPAFKAWVHSKEPQRGPIGDLNGKPVSNVDADAATLAGADHRGRADAGRSLGAVGSGSDGGQGLDHAATAPSPSRGPAQAVAGAGPNDALKVSAAAQPPQGVALSPADQVGAAAPYRVIARAGRAPGSAEPIDLRPNQDGTLTPHMEGQPLLDYDSGDPLVFKADISDLDAKKAIRAAGSLSDKTNFFPPKESRAATKPTQAVEAESGKVTARTDAKQAEKRAPKPEVFKTKDGASKARKDAGNTKKIQKVKGGFILRDMTEKEIEAAQALGKRSKRTLPVNVARDDVLQALAKMGGLNREASRQDAGVHEDYFKTNPIVGLPLFPVKGGMHPEGAVEVLMELGYMKPGQGLTHLEDLLGDALNGTPMYSMAHEYENDNGPLADFMPDELDDAGYVGDTSRVNALTEQLLSEAESLGIDTEAIREDAARITEAESDDAYHAAVQEATQGAITKARSDAARRDAGRDRASNANDGEAAGNPREAAEAEALTLEAQTPEDLQAKTDRETTALEAEAKAKADEQRRISKEDAERENRARADATVDDFALGQDATAQMSGIDDLFADKPTPQARADAAKTPAVAEQVALRKRVSVLQSLLDCLAS